MPLKLPVNPNYCATVVDIKNIVRLDNCDNVVHTNIFGNLVVVGKDTEVGDVGMFFPPETELSKDFLLNNNLYKHSELNVDKEKKGYFEDNGRIRTVKFRGNKSMGFFIPLNFLDFTNHSEKLKVGDTFDEINGIKICQKYVIFVKNVGQWVPKSKKERVSRIVDNQFRFHQDTEQLGKNIHRLKEDDIIQVSHKLHGTSAISSKVLCKKKLRFHERIAKGFKFKIIDKEYDNIYSSRQVIKNPFFVNNKKVNHFYETDIWSLANNKIKEFIYNGMSVYYEIVGYLPTNAGIQSMNGKVFDYGCEKGTFEIYIYRITYTNVDGKVFEFSAKQVQDWCKENGLKAVPELYYGSVKVLFNVLCFKYNNLVNMPTPEFNSDLFLELLKQDYLEKDCFMCKNKLPAEGIVLRIEKNDYEAYKLKSFAFNLMESKSLDLNEISIEERN